jgi:hypothetical protein
MGVPVSTGVFPPENFVRLRPKRVLFRRGVVAAILFQVPIAGVLYFLTLPDGPWLVVLITQVGAILLFLGAVVAYFRVGIWIHPTGVAERGFFGSTLVVPVKRIGSVVFVETYDPSGSETIPQLFVCDAAGRQLIRMRGQFWSKETMDQLSGTVEVPLEILADSVTNRELLDEYPGLFYWFERHPVVAAAGYSAVVIAGGALLFAILVALGITGG